MSACHELATVWTGAVLGATAGVFAGVFAFLYTGDRTALAYALAGSTGIGIVVSLLVAVRPPRLTSRRVPPASKISAPVGHKSARLRGTRDKASDEASVDAGQAADERGAGYDWPRPGRGGLSRRVAD